MSAPLFLTPVLNFLQTYLLAIVYQVQKSTDDFQPYWCDKLTWLCNFIVNNKLGQSA